MELERVLNSHELSQATGADGGGICRTWKLSVQCVSLKTIYGIRELTLDLHSNAVLSRKLLIISPDHSAECSASFEILFVKITAIEARARSDATRQGHNL